MRAYYLLSTVFGVSVSDGDVLVIGFAANEANEEYVIVSCSPELTEQDEKFGMTRYYLDTSFAGGEYACIDQVSINGSNIQFRMNDLGKRFFGVTKIEVEMLFGVEQQSHARAVMREIFEEEPNLTLLIS